MTKGIKKALKEERTEVINIRVTPKEKEIMERLAKKMNVPVSQYIRGSVMMDMLTSGDAEAMMYAMSFLGTNFKAMAREAVFGSEPVVA